MIPREILKKIRQSELRTNRSVSASVERNCERRTGVAPVSIFKSLIQRFVAHRTSGRFFRKSGLFDFRDRRDACPTARIHASRLFPSALV